jgi:DNA repair exonuclease SbcCD nuclease subunit
MHLLISSDLHNGHPGGHPHAVIWAMDIMRQYATENKIENVVIAGDLFHDRSSINIQVLNEVYDFFTRAREAKQCWFAICGNHDEFLKNSWEINSLHPLQDKLTVIENIKPLVFGIQKIWFVPFIYQEKEYMEKIKEIEDKNDVSNDILITHIGVNNAKLNECFLLKNWSFVNFDNSKFKKIYAGHFHCHQDIGKLTYPGSPIPFRFDEGVVEHGFMVHDTDTNTHKFIKIYDICERYSSERPPDYVSIIDKDLGKNLKWAKGNNVRIIQSRDYTTTELTKMREILVGKGALKVSFLLRQKQITEAKEAVSVKKLSSPETLFEAYIKHDKPELDEKLLKSLLSKIAVEADGLMSKKEVEDE